MNSGPSLKLRHLGIDSYKETVIYMRKDCHVCKAEGFESQARIRVELGGRFIIATLNTISSEILAVGEAGLSDFSWLQLKAKEGDLITVCHASPMKSFSHVRSKIYGHTLSKLAIEEIIDDIVSGRYSDIQISAFLTVCSGGRLSPDEILCLTSAMIAKGQTLTWNQSLVVDKHCVGGIPGNRTTPIVVAIVCAYGLTMPKTSSRAITSPAGTADTMEVLAPVDLKPHEMQKVVEQEGGCIVWGGAVALSPADDVLIRVEKALDLDSEGQLVASILSKKISAGSSHVLIDIPLGPTAKVRSRETAEVLTRHLELVGSALGIQVRIHTSDGTQPIGNGIGPALEARDLVSVLQVDPTAPMDLRERALDLAGQIIEFSEKVGNGQGRGIAEELLDSGKAWQKFQQICAAQGGMRTIPRAKFFHSIEASIPGCIQSINNRNLAKIAKLAGAPRDKAAGIDLHVHVGDVVGVGDPLYTIHAESQGELSYALSFLELDEPIFTMGGR